MSNDHDFPDDAIMVPPAPPPAEPLTLFSLEGCFLRVGRAHQHLKSLESEISDFLKFKPYTIVVEPDPNANRCILKVRARKHPDPMWGIVAGEIAHNLRAALDNALWRLTLDADPHIEDRGREAEAREIQYPFCLTPDDFKSACGSKLKLLACTTQAMIERFQPYSRFPGQDPKRSPLWLLRELSNRDKHRAINLAAVLYDGDILIEPRGSTTATLHINPGGYRLVKHDAIIDTVDCASSADVQVHPDNPFHIGFGEGTAPEGREVAPLLNRMLAEVTEALRYFTTVAK